MKESEYGNDVQTVKAEYERHQKEHKVIDQFQVKKLASFHNNNKKIVLQF